MPKVKVNDITVNYDQQGAGAPLILIPYLAADYACYAFQVADYAKHFTCISVDPRGAGETDKPEAVYSTELFADDVSAFMQALGVARAHISGFSLGGGDGDVACGHEQRAEPGDGERQRNVTGDGMALQKRFCAGLEEMVAPAEMAPSSSPLQWKCGYARLRTTSREHWPRPFSIGRRRSWRWLCRLGRGTRRFSHGERGPDSTSRKAGRRGK